MVALALPEIRHDVDAGAEGLQWVMNGYLLTIAVLVVTAGRLGDMFGRKRVFLAGMALFAGSTWVAVVLCAVGAVLTWAFVRDTADPSPGAGQHHMHHRRFHL